MSYPVQIPAPQETNVHLDESAGLPRWGILMGGARKIAWDGVGENSVGHHEFTRRVPALFQNIYTGRRNEGEDALSNPRTDVQWAQDPSRVVQKLAGVCARDVLENYKYVGFIVPASLIGVATSMELERKLSPILPADIAALPLVDVISHLEDQPETLLKQELTAAAYTAKNYILDYVRKRKDEMGREQGRKSVDDLDREYFWELKEALPEEKPHQATVAMGQEIAKAVAANDSGQKDDAIVNVLSKIVDRLDKLETPSADGAEIPQKRGPGRPPNVKE